MLNIGIEKNLELFKTDEIELSNALLESEKAPIVQLVEIILAQALKRRASALIARSNCLKPRREGFG